MRNTTEKNDAVPSTGWVSSDGENSVKIWHDEDGTYAVTVDGEEIASGLQYVAAKCAAMAVMPEETGA